MSELKLAEAHHKLFGKYQMYTDEINELKKIQADLRHKVDMVIKKYGKEVAHYDPARKKEKVYIEYAAGDKTASILKIETTRVNVTSLPEDIRAAYSLVSTYERLTIKNKSGNDLIDLEEEEELGL